MRRFLLLVVLVALLSLCGQTVQAEEELHAEEVHEETIDAATASAKTQPKLSPEAFAKIFEKLSNKCQKEIEANPTDPENLSPRCRNELGRKVQRALEREKEGPKEPKKQQKPKETKPKKKKKPTRAQREAAAALKKEEEYMQTVKVIVGFVGTLVAVAVGAMCVINRKLKAAGMYYPANPDERASGCCG